MRRTWVLVSLLSTAAFAQNLPGLDAYKRGDYATASREMQQALEQKKLSAQDANSTRMYLAASHFALGNSAAVKATLEELFRDSPDAQLDANIFDPDLVALSEQLRANEKTRREALAKEEAAKAEAQKKQALLEAEKKAEPPAEPVTEARAFDVRVGLFGLTDVASSPRTGTAALMVSAVISNIEVGLRAFPGSKPVSANSDQTKLTFAAGAEVGYLFFDSDLTPRVGARVTVYPGLPGSNGEGLGLGGGVVAGARYRLTNFLALGADAAAEVNATQDATRYSGFSVVLSAGAQFIF